MTSLSQAALRCVQASEPTEKIRLSREVGAAWHAGRLAEHQPEQTYITIVEPGYPQALSLVEPLAVPRRNVRTLEGRAALLHALLHIEYTAISLAWDAVYRFPGLPQAYYQDWIQVALEEVEHFTLLQGHLQRLGYKYGDFSAHAGLWEMACKTDHDWLARMAMVPRTLEARGLDVTPGIISKLESVGDGDAVAILRIVQRDEIGHVAIGNRWFIEACTKRNLPVQATYLTLLENYLKGRLKPPLNHAARLSAGFSSTELHALEAWLTEKTNQMRIAYSKPSKSAGKATD